MILNIFFFILRAIFLIVLPFLILIRGSIFFYSGMDFSTWPSLAGGILVTAFILYLYMTFVYGRITGKETSARGIKQRLVFALLVVVGFSLHALVFYSNTNMKSPEVEKAYSSLHPFLKLGVSTVVLVDKELVVTDAERGKEDYERMGLEKKNQSLHFKQEDGYTYAMDFRTNDRSEWRNQALAVYFGAMGFNVLRHVGTADHLHISLPCKFHPGAK